MRRDADDGDREVPCPGPRRQEEDMTMTDNERCAILAEWPYRLGPDEAPNVYVRARADRVTAAVCAYFEMAPTQVGDQYAKRDALEARTYLVYLLGVGHPDPALAWEGGLIPEGHARLLPDDIGRYMGLKPGILRMALESIRKTQEEEAVTFRMTVQELRADIARRERDELRRAIAGDGPQAQQHLATMDLRQAYFAKVERVRVPRFSGVDRMEEERRQERDAFREQTRSTRLSPESANTLSAPPPWEATVPIAARETLSGPDDAPDAVVSSETTLTVLTPPATPAEALVFPRSFGPPSGAQIALWTLDEASPSDSVSRGDTRIAEKTEKTEKAGKTEKAEKRATSMGWTPAPVQQLSLLEVAHGW